MSAASPDLRRTVLIAGVLSSLISDFGVRVVPKSTVRAGVINRLAVPAEDHPLEELVILRVLQLNCVTEAYASLWNSLYRESFAFDEPVLPRQSRASVGPNWLPETPWRIALDRRNAQVEVDALVALMLGLSIDDLCSLYKTQFAVLHGYDQREYTYDARGRLVPNSVLSSWRRRGGNLSREERTVMQPGSGVEYVYELPFRTFDREADMRTAYAEFKHRLAEIVT